MRAPILGVLCLLGAIGWAALATIALMFAGWGDGATTGANRYDQVVAYMPSLYLLLLFGACFRKIPVLLVNLLLSLAMMVLLIFSILLFRLGQMGLVIPLPFIGMGIVAYRRLCSLKDG
jgi:hypothetical protein